MSDATTTEQQELEALRARVAALEAEHREQLARAHARIAALQEQVYWLDRWRIDLNAIMRKPGAAEFRAAVRIARGVLRRAKALKRRILG